jgi:hypothetical protein
MSAVTTKPKWFPALGAGIVVLISYTSVKNAVPEGFQSWLTPIIVGCIAGCSVGFFQRLWSIPTGTDLRNILTGKSEPFISLRSVEDRLDELERLKRRDMVTPEEYAAKRQEILKDL